MSREQFDGFVNLAGLNHVIVRALKVFVRSANAQHQAHTGWAEGALADELSRVKNAIRYLRDICQVMQEAGHQVAVIKSLDHWPDLGSDLDLYTNADPGEIVRLMKRRFQAELAPRSWGDRLANKWNFLIPGLPEAVEIHMGRLGKRENRWGWHRG